MQPPFHFTSNPNFDWIILVVSSLVCLYSLRALRLAREGARLFLRNFVIASLIYFASATVFATLRVPQKSTYIFAGFISLIVFAQRQKRRRSRYIPKPVKRAVIERDLRDGEYDPARHHIDHVWPFSKGGSHTQDNLRVIAKEKNLKKGAKRPRITEMW